jgi:hypothetical protein
MAWTSGHFQLSEFLLSEVAARRGLDNTPDLATLANLERLAGVLERVRDICGGHPIVITSGYRSVAVNAAVGGSTSSSHTIGLAVDFVIPKFGTASAVCRALQPHMEALGIDQNIDEFPPNGWTHIGLCALSAKPRCQCLTIDAAGTRAGFA